LAGRFKPPFSAPENQSKALTSLNSFFRRKNHALVNFVRPFNQKYNIVALRAGGEAPFVALKFLVQSGAVAKAMKHEIF
jgi:hypothetical protein